MARRRKQKDSQPPADSLPTPPPRARFNRLTWILLAILTLSIVIAFSGVRNASFIEYDDELYVFNNSHVMGGLTSDNVAWAWEEPHWGYYIPMTWMSLQLDASLSGEKISPAPSGMGALPSATLYHLHNLLLHILASSLLFLFLDRATGLRWQSFAIALLWAVHPLRTESVAWVTERKDSLAGLFGFLSLYLYILWRQRPHPGWYLATALAMALSLLCKSSFITLPFVMLLLDAWPLNRIEHFRDLLPAIREKWPLFSLTFAAAIITFLAQHQEGALRSAESLGFLAMASNALVSYSRYLVLHVNFDALALFHPYVLPDTAAIVASAILLAAVTAFCLWQRIKRPWLLVGWFWFLGAMVPMIGLIQSGDQGYADRFTYFPSVGLFAMGIFSIPNNWLEDPRRRPVSLTLLGIVAVILIAFTVRQVAFWHDTITLFNHTVAVTPPNFTAHHQLSQAYLRQGRPDLAAEEYERSLQINPQNVQALMGLGALYLSVHQPDQALPYLQRAAEAAPRSEDAHNIYGSALGMSGRLDEARAEFEKVLAISPGNEQARRNLDITRRALATRAASSPATSH